MVHPSHAPPTNATMMSARRAKGFAAHANGPVLAFELRAVGAVQVGEVNPVLRQRDDAWVGEHCTQVREDGQEGNGVEQDRVERAPQTRDRNTRVDVKHIIENNNSFWRLPLVL